MVCPELEMVALQHDPKMPDGVEGSQKHPVESRELALCFRQLPKEKTKRPPSSSLPLLEDTANVAAEASVARDSSAVGSGWERGTAAARATLMASAVACISVVQQNTLGFPLRASVRGQRVRAAAGRNLR